MILGLPDLMSSRVLHDARILMIPAEHLRAYSRAFAQLRAEGVTGHGRRVSVAHLRKYCVFDEIL